MKKKVLSTLFCVVVVLMAVFFAVSAADQGQPFVTNADTTPDAVLDAWATGSYSYIRLGADLELTLAEQDIVIDLAGNNLSITGSGKVSAFDSANDTYDHLACGVLTAAQDVQLESLVDAPNGNRYITLTEGQYTTVHRLNMKLTSVVLRMSNAGIYYKAVYTCDRMLEEKVQSYGVAVSTKDMPRSDFATAADDLYTMIDGKEFVSGAAVNSGIITDILNNDPDTDNQANMNTTVYARLYIQIDDVHIMANTGAATKLKDILEQLDSRYDSFTAAVRRQLDGFYNTWSTAANWSTANIGKSELDLDKINADLNLVDGKAVCPVGGGDPVEWIPMTSTTESTTAVGGGHYYLPDDLIFDNDNEKPFMYAPGANQTACFHLNGHNVTSLNWRVFHSGSGKLNIMGKGEVAGYNKKSIHGAAIHSTNKNAGSEFVLYGGTFKKVSGTPYTGAVIYISDAGGNLTVYEDVVIQADSNGKAGIYTATNTYRECNVTLYGCTVNGAINLESAIHDTNLEMIDTTVKGNITVRTNNNITLAGKVSLTRLTTQEDSRVTLKSLDPDAYIKINAPGEFTTESSGIGKYMDCFTPYNSGDKVFVKNNALYCGRDYACDLVFAEGTTDAYCPVCNDTKTWTQIVGGSDTVNLVDGGHYYLSEDQKYTGTGTAFLSFANKADVCVHLNGHDLTSNARALYTGTGTTNIMGTGVVSGAPYNSDTYGTALHHNSKSGTINLYSGTYRQTEGVAASGYTLNMQGAGGTLNVYDDAVVEGTNGNAIRIGNAGSANIAVKVIGATVDGKVYMAGAKTPETYTASLTLDGAKVNGTVDINGTNNFTVVHDTRIDLLDMEDTTKVTLDRMTEGARIYVKNAGEFAGIHDHAADYQKYFLADHISDRIVAQDNILTYKVNYTSNLLPDAENEALCPVCREIVTWTAFTDDTQAHTFTDGGHFYLTKDLTYTTADTFLTTGAAGSVTCLHLNGHNITSTNAYTIFIGSGYLNVMGEGTVMGKTENTARGTAIYANNKTATNGVSLYSGTYTKYDSSASVPIVTLGANGGNITVYEDAVLDAPSTGMAVNTGNATNRNSTFRLVGATVKGDITIPGASSTSYQSVFESVNGTITGDVKVNGTAQVTFSGRTKIGKLLPKTGETVTFENMLDGSSVKVSADGVFSTYMAEADDWLQYFSTSDTGDWLIVRDKTFYQGAKTGLTAAEQADIDSLLAAYGDRVIRFGEAHNHSASGPTGGADGYKSIAEWKAGMIDQNMDFAVIVDHRQSSHMYVEDWDNDQVTFIGGTETGTDITDLPKGKNNIHMNLIFSDVQKFEELINSGHPQFTNVAEAPEGWSGYTFKAGACSQQDIRDLAALVRELGGFFAHVHPKYDGYVDSEDPLDYYYGEHTGIEVMCATSSKSDSRKDWNVKAYDLWVDLLELDKKVYATYGNDDHNLPTTYSLTAMYTETKSADDYMLHMRAGDFTPGWVGVRMQIGDALMGGETDFAGQKLVISAGEMFAGKYDSTHKYAIQLYDDGGLLLESELDPSQMNYYAMDADPEAEFYRVLIWDTTIGAHVAVGNPIWNSNVTTAE